ncbi:MAG: hypothetical protein IJ315_04190 [Firmicutes bacterium]|nr:hypothetical protein [Bacillota bacterium]
MGNWILNTVNDVADWLGSGIASLIEWLLGGLVDMFTLIIDAANGIWLVLESLWNLGTGFLNSVLNALSVFFPFLPEPVSAAIGAGLLAVLIAGIVKKVRGS